MSWYLILVPRYMQSDPFVLMAELSEDPLYD